MHVLAHAYGSNAVLKSPRDCTMLGVVDETRRTYRHHGRQRDAPRRIATFRHATQRVAPHRYATLEPLWKPGGSRAFIADGPPQAPVAPRRSCERNICERMNSPLRDVPCSNADIDLRPERDQAGRHHRIPINQSADFSDGHFAPGSVRLSQKSHKVAVLLGIILLSALSLPDRREGGSGGSRCRRAVRALLGWFKGP